jgi:hypothetical protein
MMLFSSIFHIKIIRNERSFLLLEGKLATVVVKCSNSRRRRTSYVRTYVCVLEWGFMDCQNESRIANECRDSETLYVFNDWTAIFNFRGLNRLMSNFLDLKNNSMRKYRCARSRSSEGSK